MAVSAQRLEACVSGDDSGVWIVTAELDHESFPEPIRVVQGVDGLDVDEELFLPVEEGGQKLAHKACPFGFTPPGSDRDGPTEGKVQMEGISAELDGYAFDAMAQQANTPSPGHVAEKAIGAVRAARR